MQTAELEPHESTNSAIPELSVDTQLLVKRLKKCAEDEMVTYDELSGIIGRDVTAKARHILDSARRILQRQDRMVFECVHGQGVKRLNDSAMANLGEHGIKRIRGISKRTARKIACSDYENLSNEDKIKSNASLSMLGALSMMTAPKKLKALETSGDVANNKVPSAKVLEMFSK